MQKNTAIPSFPTLAEIEQQAIEDALTLCNGSITRAAHLLGVAPSTLYRKRQGKSATADEPISCN